MAGASICGFTEEGMERTRFSDLDEGQGKYSLSARLDDARLRAKGVRPTLVAAQRSRDRISAARGKAPRPPWFAYECG